MSILRTIDLSKRFRGTQALDGLSLDVPEGSVFALIGANGAGKTTAIKWGFRRSRTLNPG